MEAQKVNCMSLGPKTLNKGAELLKPGMCYPEVGTAGTGQPGREDHELLLPTQDLREGICVSRTAQGHTHVPLNAPTHGSLKQRLQLSVVITGSQSQTPILNVGSPIWATGVQKEA